MEVYPRANPPLAPKGTLQAQRLMIWMILIISLASIALFGFVVWTMQQSTLSQQARDEFKTVTLDTVGTQVTFEAPRTWSVYKNPSNYGSDNVLATPTASVGQTSVVTRDNPNAQVNFYFVREDVIDWQLLPFENVMPGALSKERVAGFTADVVTTNLRPTDYVKFGTRGKAYYIRLPGPLKTLVIDKEVLGDVSFEDGFAHMINTMQFTF